MVTATGSFETQMNAWALDDAEYAVLQAAGDWFTAGFLHHRDRSVVMRHAQAITNFLKHCPLSPYTGELLYPTTGSIWQTDMPMTCWHHYVAIDVAFNSALAAEKGLVATTPFERQTWEKVRSFCDEYPHGGGWTHSIINFAHVLEKGLDRYIERIHDRLSLTNDQEKQELYHALLTVVAAIDEYRARVTDYLESLTFSDAECERNRARLANAYRSRLSMRPASGFYEAMVATTFLYAIDGSDDLGRFDQYMWPYYRQDLAAGQVTRDEALTLIHALWRYVDDCSGWNVTLAGTTSDGKEASNELTLLCLEAAHHLRRPNLALRLRHDTPEAVWDAATDTLATGTGLPALYSEENYLRAIDLAQLNLPDADKHQYAFGGCTELMIHGCSNVGSLDGDYSVIKTLEASLTRHLPDCATFEEFLRRFEDDIRTGIADLTARVNRNQEIRAIYHPQLIRTLLIDDCLDRGKNFSNGGARYNWSVINIVGLSNAIDSLTAVRKALFEDRYVDTATLLAALAANFTGYENLRGYLQRCPHFGNDDPQVNALAHELSGFVYKEFKRYAPWRGGRFLCGTLMFVTYGNFGCSVGATPDGRLAAMPVADSAGPVQGRDSLGPTAMLQSVSSLQQIHAPGTLVVNMRLARKLFTTRTGREQLKSLIRSYFQLGGMQLQITVVDQAVLRDALAHPEQHGDLIVRVGGYSEYFNLLDENVKLAVLERTEHY